PDAAQRAPLIWSRMRAALKFRKAPLGVIVTIGLATASVVQRDALIVAERWAAGTLVVIFMDAFCPDSGKIRKRQCRSALWQCRHRENQKRQSEPGAGLHVSSILHRPNTQRARLPDDCLGPRPSNPGCY